MSTRINTVYTIDMLFVQFKVTKLVVISEIVGPTTIRLSI